jgi:hypothetical protein
MREDSVLKIGRQLIEPGVVANLANHRAERASALQLVDREEVLAAVSDAEAFDFGRDLLRQLREMLFVSQVFDLLADVVRR